MQLLHQFLVLLVLLIWVGSVGRFPVSIGLRTYQKVVLLVILDSETEFAAGYIGSDNALISAFVHKGASTGRALKASLGVCPSATDFSTLTTSSRSGSSTSFVQHILNCHTTSCISCSPIIRLNSCHGRLFPLLPRLGVLFEDLDAHRAPIRSTEGAEQRLARRLIVLEAPRQTVRVDLATATISTV